MLTIWCSDSVAIIDLPSGDRKTSSGVLNVWPGLRSPFCGKIHRGVPEGSTTTMRLLPSSAIMIGPGRAVGSDLKAVAAFALAARARTEPATKTERELLRIDLVFTRGDSIDFPENLPERHPSPHRFVRERPSVGRDFSSPIR